MNNKGFSLVEVLISLVLMSMMIVSVIEMTNSAGEVKEKILAEDEEKLVIEMAMARITKDIDLFFSNSNFALKLNPKNVTKNIKDEDALDWVEQKSQETNKRFPSFSENYQPIPVLQYNGEDSIEFMSVGNQRRYQNQKSSRFNWIRYSIENDQDGELKILKRYIYSSNPFNKENFDFENIKGQTLLNNLSEFKFFFWDRDKEKFVEDFSPSNPNHSPLTGLRIEFKWKDSLEREFTYSRTFRTLWPVYKIEDENQILQLQNTLKPLKKKSS